MQKRWLGIVLVISAIVMMVAVFMWPYLDEIDPMYRIPLYFPSLILSAIGLYMLRISTDKESSV